MDNIRSKMARGAAWMVAFKGVERMLGLVSTLVLARLLAPADFGVVAMATSLMAMLELFSAFGLDAALIQRTNATRTHYDTAWTLNICAGAVIAILMLALAWPMSLYFREPRATGAIAVLAAAAIVIGLENIGVIAFRKEMNFRKEFVYLACKRVGGLIATVSLALWLRSYWALVFGNLIGRVVGVILSFALHPYRPRLSLRAVGDFFHFSKWLVLQNGLGFLRDRSADFVIGRMAGPHTLGVFTLSSEISSMPGSELVAPINRAVFPAYAAIAHDPAAMRREYLSVMSVIMMIATPAVAGVALTAPLIVALLLGPKWIEASDVIAVLAFFGIARVLQSNAYAAFLAMGKPQTFVRITAIHVCILVPMLVILTRFHGVMGAAWAYVLTEVIAVPVALSFIVRGLKIPTLELLGQFWRPLAAAASMYLVIDLLFARGAWRGLASLEALGVVAIAVPLAAAIYIASIGLLWLLSGKPEGAETMLARKVGSYVQRLRYVKRLA
jgi:lipopolysaccharide exporter